MRVENTSDRATKKPHIFLHGSSNEFVELEIELKRYLARDCPSSMINLSVIDIKYIVRVPRFNGMRDDDFHI